MKTVLDLCDVENSKSELLYKKDTNDREIKLFEFNDIKLCGDVINYPNTYFYDIPSKKIYYPICETTMSLKNANIKKNEFIVTSDYNKTYDLPLFFFIYNTENYYHFIYDTLPYLISFFKKKKKEKDLKILMYFPIGKTKFYNFVLEFLELLGISQDDIIIADRTTKYKKIYVSSSYTYGDDPNKPPRKEIYKLYKKISDSIKGYEKNTPKKIYISRRSNLHNDFSNIGTNYTNRRVMKNEDELVSFLEKKGFVEVFTETLTTKEKIILFNNADEVVGSIGGGLCNVLFSPKTTKLHAIISPVFLEVNKRFIFSLNRVKLNLFKDTQHYENTFFKKNMRITFNDKVGEITKIDGENLHVIYSDHNVVGWSEDNNYKTIILNQSQCNKIDDGLNCEWVININNFKKYIC
jgi:hypothetical protein